MRHMKLLLAMLVLCGVDNRSLAGPVCPIESAGFCQSAQTAQFYYPNDRLLGVRRADDFRPTGGSVQRICWYPCFIGVTAEPGGHECSAPGTTPPDAFIAKIYENDFGKPGLLVSGIPGGGLELVVDSKAQIDPGSRCWRYSAPILPPQGLQVTPGDCLWLEVTGLGEVQAGGTCVIMTVDTADGNSYSMFDENDLYEQNDFVKLDLAFCLDCGIEGESNPPGSQDGGCGNFPVACCKPDGTDPGTLPDCIDGGTYQQCVGTQGFPLVGVPFPFTTCADIGGPAGCPVPANDLCQNAVTPVECQNQLPIPNPGTCALSGGVPNIQEPCNLDVGSAPDHDCINGFTTCLPLSELREAYHCRFETSNMLATTDGPSLSGSHCSGSGVNSFQADIWFKYVAPCDGYMSVIHCRFANYDSMIQVFGNHTATCPSCPISNNMQSLGCSDDNCSACCAEQASETRIDGIKEGACYLIRMGGWSQIGSTSDARQAESGLDIGVVCDPPITTDPPVAAPAPYDRKKNRYISFVPNNGATAVAFRVQKTVAPMGSCWVQTPVQTGSNQYTAACGATPVFRVWNEPVVHVGDCEIVPVASYSIFTNAPGPVENPTPLVVQTIDTPSVNGKLWGDVAGTNNGMEWTVPNQLTNTQDILAVLAYVSNAAVKPTFQVVNLQAISAVDPCLNAFVNTADVLIVVKAAAGDAYPFTTNPGSCPVCP